MKPRVYGIGIGPGDLWFTTCYQLPVFSVKAFDRWCDKNMCDVVPVPLSRILRIKTLSQMEVVSYGCECQNCKRFTYPKR